ncbi:MAG: transcription elongation factor GreA [Candidatus Vogelbacteria bacterium]|nr:transcription elongation factor GreA [Candidatus Vogelbacteria bacterium]
MDSAKEYLSQEKHDALVKELEQLKTTERREVATQLEFAKSLGDLSENAEYHEARDRQADIEDRIAKIEDILKHAAIIGQGSHSLAEIGSKVTVRKNSPAGENGKEEEFTLVGSEEADVTKGKISYQSPLGSALMGKKKGITITVSTPKGDVNYTISAIK